MLSLKSNQFWGYFHQKQWEILLRLSNLVEGENHNLVIIILLTFPSTILVFVYAGAAKPDFIFLAEVIHGFAVCPVTRQVLQIVFLTNELSE